MPSQTNEPECTCSFGPDEVDFDPACFYHGDNGTMVVRVPLAKRGVPAQPRKAYEVTYAVRVEMAGTIYANSAAEAVAQADKLCESTGVTRKINEPRAQRFPDADR